MYKKGDYVKFNHWVGYVVEAYKSSSGEVIYKIMWAKNALLQNRKPDIVHQFLDKLQPANQGAFISRLDALMQDIEMLYDDEVAEIVGDSLTEKRMVE